LTRETESTFSVTSDAQQKLNGIDSSNLDTTREQRMFGTTHNTMEYTADWKLNVKAANNFLCP